MVTALVGERHYVVGVDGGASKTVAIIGDQDGEIVGRGKAGSSNFHNISVSAAGKAIQRAVYDAKKGAGILGKQLEIAVVALAGVDSPRDKMIAYRFVRQTTIAHSLFVVHDAVAALYAVTRGEPGIIVISGTGSVAAGINSSGEYARVGGYGYLISDEGSAFDIGRNALMLAFRALDGRAPWTKLVSILKRRFGVKYLEDLLSKLYSNGLMVEEVGRLAPIVSREASSDAVCRQIMRDAGISLGELACAVARRLRMTRSRVTVATAGGNFKAGYHLMAPFKARIRRECPRAQFTSLANEPAVGAYALAVSALGRGLTRIDRLFLRNPTK
jgi:N-acetylglucosamine kinase-like BadF-type ATPase